MVFFKEDIQKNKISFVEFEKKKLQLQFSFSNIEKNKNM
jgi:hypothetical protein